MPLTQAATSPRLFSSACPSACTTAGRAALLSIQTDAPLHAWPGAVTQLFPQRLLRKNPYHMLLSSQEHKAFALLALFSQRMPDQVALTFYALDTLLFILHHNSSISLLFHT